MPVTARGSGAAFRQQSAVSPVRPSAAGGGFRRYFEVSRSHRYSILFALPLLVLYELLAASLATPEGGIRNGADVLLRMVFQATAGQRGSTVFIGAVILLGLWLVIADKRRSRGRFEPRVFLLMLGESAMLAVLFGLVVGTITAHLLGWAQAFSIGQIADASWQTRLMLSLGAGLYEELLFRVLLVSALAAGARIVLGAGKGSAGVIAAVVGALVFSAFHYIPPHGDTLELASFTFRAVGGLVFSAMYLVRGFGITTASAR
jgi:hypothetical protein